MDRIGLFNVEPKATVFAAPSLRLGARRKAPSNSPNPKSKIQNPKSAWVLALAFALLWFLHTTVVEGILLPVRVVGGSMAPHLCGAGWHVACSECGWAFFCGAEYAPPRQHATCPNCGSQQNSLDDKPFYRGQRVLLDKLSFRCRLPRRWETVVTHDPTEPRGWAVKRVVGLPGECVSIEGGDVLIDRSICRKNLAQLRQMAVVVHDDHFRPGGTRAARWQGDEGSTLWRQTSKGYRFEPTDQVHEGADLRWLSYRQPAIGCPTHQPEEFPVTDDDSYHQGLSRRLNEVGDLMLFGQCTLAGTGVFAFRCHDGRAAWDVRVSLPDGGLRLCRDRHAVAAAHGPTTWCRTSFAFGVCDQQVFLVVGGKPLIHYACQAPAEPWQPTSRPFALGSATLHADVESLKILRDVFYTHPKGLPAPWRCALGRDEYLLLGDNSAVSRDGRHWDRPIRRAELAARLIAW